VDLRQLEYFLRVAQRKSISLAAADLNIAQPTLTKSIKLLEQQLGVRLFEWLPRGVVLTPFGPTLLRRAEARPGQGCRTGDRRSAEWRHWRGRDRRRTDLAAMPSARSPRPHHLCPSRGPYSRRSTITAAASAGAVRDRRTRLSFRSFHSPFRISRMCILAGFQAICLNFATTTRRLPEPTCAISDVNRPVRLWI
jgi:Bacterial regulatory helix-turn-helix protein, lysR family